MSQPEIEEALKVLRSGGILLYPTDTVWGLGCDATSNEAVEKIIALKKRTADKSFVVLVNSEVMLERYVKDVPEMAWQLIEIADKPLTIVYPGVMNIAAKAVAADGTLGIRLVKQSFCSELIRKFGKPIISTSANISGEPSPSRFDEISKEIKEGVDHIVPVHLETGSTGKPSSIIKLGLKSEISIIRK